jgi:sugar-phosphatase
VSGTGPLTIDAAAILFDNDGVLSDSLAAVNGAWRQWARNHGLDPQPILAHVHGRPARESIARFMPNGDQEAAFADLERLELDTAGDTREIPGARRLTSQVPSDRWIVVTSGSRLLAGARLSTIGIDPPATVTADDVRRGKPDPEPYLAAARKLGFDPSECLVFEDTSTGVTAAKAAGSTVLGVVGPDGGDIGADHHVRDLTEVEVAVRPDGGLRVSIGTSTEY